MLYFFAGMGGNAFGSGLNPVAMQAALSGGGGMPFFGGAFGGSRAGKYYYCDYVMYYILYVCYFLLAVNIL